MITVSDKSRTAVAALTELAQRPGVPVPITEVAEARGVALHVLEQLFASLRRAGILQSQRGVKGGYSLRMPAASVTLHQVVEAVDGRLDDVRGTPPTPGDAVWQEAAARLRDLLTEVTIADMLEREARALDAPMFHI